MTKSDHRPSCLICWALMAAFVHFLGVSCVTADPQVSRPAEQIEAAFGRKCEKLLIREIDRAEKEILVAIYSITREKIASALVEAAKRGVKIRVKYDAEQFEDLRWMKLRIRDLVKHGIECIAIETKAKYASMHHKFTVIDRKCVLTGSYNYTRTASTVSYENLVLINSADIARKFAEEFEAIKSR